MRWNGEVGVGADMRAGGVSGKNGFPWCWEAEGRAGLRCRIASEAIQNRRSGLLIRVGQPRAGSTPNTSLRRKRPRGAAPLDLAQAVRFQCGIDRDQGSTTRAPEEGRAPDNLGASGGLGCSHPVCEAARRAGAGNRVGADACSREVGSGCGDRRPGRHVAGAARAFVPTGSMRLLRSRWKGAHKVSDTLRAAGRLAYPNGIAVRRSGAGSGRIVRRHRRSSANGRSRAHDKTARLQVPIGRVRLAEARAHTSGWLRAHSGQGRFCASDSIFSHGETCFT